MKKVGYFFFCFLPIIASVGLQFVAAFPIMGFRLLHIFFSCIFSGRKIPYTDLIWQFSNELNDSSVFTAISVLYAALGIFVFGFWYLKQFSGNLRFPLKKFANPFLVLGIIFMVPALQMASAFLTGISAAFFPKWMDFYENMMESAGFSQEPSLLLVLYAVLLGPIAEELIFRGVTLSSARKALPLWAANLFQAFLFGVFHMNVIQGIYAFFIGLFLGYICGRGGSVWLSIFLHILFNFWGTFAFEALYSIPLLIVFLLLGILGIILFHKNTSSSGVKHLANFSDI